MNFQEKSVQLESKQLQLISKIKELNNAFEVENDQRRLIESKRKKEFNDYIDVSKPWNELPSPFSHVQNFNFKLIVFARKFMKG